MLLLPPPLPLLLFRHGVLALGRLLMLVVVVLLLVRHCRRSSRFVILRLVALLASLLRHGAHAFKFAVCCEQQTRSIRVLRKV